MGYGFYILCNWQSSYETQFCNLHNLHTSHCFNVHAVFFIPLALLEFCKCGNWYRKEVSML